MTLQSVYTFPIFPYPGRATIRRVKMKAHLYLSQLPEMMVPSSPTCNAQTWGQQDYSPGLLHYSRVLLEHGMAVYPPACERKSTCPGLH